MVEKATLQSESEHPLMRGTSALILGAVLFGVMAVLAKAATVRLPGLQVAFVRFVVGIAFCSVAATRIRLRARNWLGLALRGLFGGAAVFFYFLTIQHLPVGLATLLNYTAPVFTAVWATFFLHEPIGRQALSALVVTSVGVFLVVKGNAGQVGLSWGSWQAIGILSAALSGAAVATIREVRKTDGAWEIFAAFCAGGALMTVVPCLNQWVSPTGAEWLILVAMGTVSMMAQMLMTYALRYLRAALAGVIMQLTPVTALLLGFWLYRETIEGLALLGAAVTLAGVSWGAWIAANPPVTSQIKRAVANRPPHSD